MSDTDLLLLVAVLLPPTALDIFGEFVEERIISTPYGEVGPLACRKPDGGPDVWIQPYTGLPTRTDPRATIFAARELGLTRILNWDTGVALNPVLHRGQSLIVEDYVDWTRNQPNSFLSDGLHGRQVDEIDSRPAFCPQLTGALRSLLPDAPGIVYLGVDGPRRETPAEARMFRAWGMDVIGQNLVPEVALAQELGICYTGLVTVDAHAADRPAWVVDGEVRESLGATIRALPALLPSIAGQPECSCRGRLGSD